MNVKLSNLSFSVREVYVLQMPADENKPIRNPENIVLQFGRKSVDIGSLCYSIRSEKVRHKNKPKEVVKSSFIPSRTKVIIRLIRLASSLAVGKSSLTVKENLESFKSYVDYGDNNQIENLLDFGENSEKGFIKYCNHIFDRYRRGDITSRTGQQLQSMALDITRQLSGNRNFGSEARLIIANRVSNNETLPASQREFAQALAISQMIFNGLVDNLLNNSPFPFQLKLPNSLNWETGNHLWIFPTLVWYMPPKYWGNERSKLDSPFWAYDYENGRIAEVDEVWKYFHAPTERRKRYKANKTINFARDVLLKANQDALHPRRLKMAQLAMKAFLFLFYANTGVNTSVLNQIETEDDIDVDVINQSYRAIKYRASGKKIVVRVPVSFMPQLRKFMSLRKYVLNGLKTTRLFFRFDKFDKSNDAVLPMTKDPMDTFFRVLSDIDPSIKVIRPRKIRATLNDWYLRHHDVSIVANVMGHSEVTENLKYGRGSPIDQQEEMTTFLEGVSAIAKQHIVSTREAIASAKTLEQGGGCSDYGNPISLVKSPPVQPNCMSNCWYCSNRQLVNDEEDVRKIASAIFVMEQLILGPGQEAALRPLIEKCESDLKLIEEAGNTTFMVERIKHDVFSKGRLTMYWTEKYNLFCQLGIIV